MGETTEFPSTKFRIVPPARRLSPADRVAAAYDLVARAEEPLRDANTPANGYRLIGRAAIVSAALLIGADETKRWLADIAAEVDHHLTPPGGSAA